MKSGTACRRGLFRWLAVLSPAALLALVECGLRLFGFGYPTHYLISDRTVDFPRLVDNPKFAWRFFPPALARAPLPLAVTPAKPQGTYRVLIFGESAAQGHPAPAIGFSRVLGTLLQARLAEWKFEMVNTAMTAINSHGIRLIAQDAARVRADLWIIYMGHNEVVGPFGAGTICGPRAPNSMMVRAWLALTATRTGQWLAELGRRLGPSVRPYWQGLEMFANHHVRADDPRLESVYANFEANLGAIIRLATGAGAKVAVCTVASNLKDCPPFVSLHRPGLSPAQQERWEQRYAAGIHLESSGRAAGAIEQYRQAAAEDAQFAELQFRWARCCLSLGRREEARRHFELARDDDALRLRADSRLQQIIARAASAQAGPGVMLVDAAKALTEQSPEHIPGGEFFYEHVHLNQAGNYWLARCLAEQVAWWLPAALPQGGAPKPWLSMDECLRRLGWTGLNDYQVARQMSRWLRQSPFDRQLGYQERAQFWAKKVEDCRAYTEGEALSRAVAVCQEALAAKPTDWMLQENLAWHLEQAQEVERAIQCWRALSQGCPQDVRAYLKLGELLDRVGRPTEAQEYYHKALQWRPNSFEARHGLGLCLAHQGHFGQAVRQYHRALEINPDLLEARINLGLACFALGNVGEALAEHEKVVRAEPDNVAAHVNLGKLLEGQHRPGEAKTHFIRALGLQPGNAVAHYNLANLLAVQGQWPEALPHYVEAIRLNPSASEARLRFADELAQRGQFEEAARQFAAMVRLRPADPQGHLRFGAALIRLGKRQEGGLELREALKLDPTLKTARELLSRLERNE